MMQVKPLITEKSLRNIAATNTYMFSVISPKVAVTAETMAAFIEATYKEKPLAIRVSNRLGKVKRIGSARREFNKYDSKIFYIQMAKGVSLPEFEIKNSSAAATTEVKSKEDKSKEKEAK